MGGCPVALAWRTFGFFSLAIPLFWAPILYTPPLRAFDTAPLAQSDPVLVGAGDIAICGSPYPEMTAKLLDGISGTVYTLGDNVYERGKLTEFQKCYGPTWGRHLARTMPAVGNHEYETAGANGYYHYFGAAASPLDQPCTNSCKGYYSYNLGAWHIVVLNSEQDVGVTSEQVQWLRADLAAHPASCTLAYWHKPRFSSGVSHGSNPYVQPFWDVLYEYGADVVLGGHDHIYERFAPQDPNAKADPQNGIRQFVVGTGGKGLHAVGSPKRNSEVQSSHAYGVLKLTLHAESYSWEFVPVEGQGFTDAGSAPCVRILPTPTATS
ncbi:MAG: metallophosphoesterase, partial [Caldilineaceae bacterium]|nr:metallophosphoesterase [Caldilineaceae bacterium]